jgi:hypothetical protein
MLDQMRDRDTLVLTLQTFSLSPIISFKDVHLGEIRTKRLYIENPSNSEVEVSQNILFLCTTFNDRLGNRKSMLPRRNRFGAELVMRKNCTAIYG